MTEKLDELLKAHSKYNITGLLGKLRYFFFDAIKEKKVKHQRFLPLADYCIDRWERAQYMGFGEGASIYDSSLVLGEVQVGRNTWVGPFTILDGSGGGLRIGDNCAISAGVHIYTHDTVDKVIHGKPISLAPVVIGNNVYVGPNVVISKGITIGDRVIIGAGSFVNKSLPTGVKVFGVPAKIVGNVDKDNEQ